MPTRTGPYPIGFRPTSGMRQWAPATLAAWARAAGFDALDLNVATPADVATVRDAGLRLGTVDLLDMGQIACGSPEARRELVARNVAYVRDLAAAGAKLFFTVVIGERERTRAENYAAAIEAFAPIADAAAAAGAKIVIEGWPGPHPWYPALCCTPETCRAFIRDTNPTSVGINYDPSHLIRLGVDHVRFLREFLPHVHHVHGKDTALDPEAAYEFGLYQRAAFAKPHGYGEHAWRYTIPGQGCARWPEIVAVLQAARYNGVVSVELEDANFHGSEPAEQAGLAHALAFLRGV